MIETIEQAFKLHDKYQFEIKLDYELLQDKKTHYQILTYIFVPVSLGITRDSYSKSNFYQDVQNYIRLKTPILILREFTHHSASPLLVIERITSIEDWANDPDCQERVLTSFKFLSAMLKSSIREHFNLIHKRIAEASPDVKINLIIHNLVQEFLIETGNITARFRSYFTVFNLPNVGEELFAAYKIADESISLQIEESAMEMYQIVTAHLKKGERIEFQQQLEDRVSQEIRHRKALGYRSILKENDDNEEFAFRVSALKKYAASVLYLSTAIRREGTVLEQIVLAVAAGLAMIFATVVAFYFQQRYGNFTFSFFVALVVGYMFKDRIKELGRILFSGYLRNVLFDRRIIIRTLDSKHKLGMLKEKVSFIPTKDVPKKVMALRNRDQMATLANLGYDEYVICYAKDITLYTNAFKVLYADLPEVPGINDIMRYDIHAYLKKMAEPVQERSYLEAGQLKTVFFHKVYQLNFISKYTAVSSRKEKIYKHSRLVLNQEGIKRVEHILV